MPSSPSRPTTRCSTSSVLVGRSVLRPTARARGHLAASPSQDATRRRSPEYGVRPARLARVPRRRAGRGGAVRRLAADGDLLAHDSASSPQAPSSARTNESRAIALDRARDRSAERRRSGPARAPARARAAAARARRRRRRGHPGRGRGVDGVHRRRARRRGAEAARTAAGAVDPRRRLGDPETARDHPRAAARRPAHPHRQGRRHRPDRGPGRRPRPAARARPHLPRPRAERLLLAAPGACLPDDRARAGAPDERARRRQRGGARRPRPVRSRAARSASPSSPTASSCRSGARRTTRHDRGFGAARSRRRHVRDRLGGPADRDQAAARPRAHAAGPWWTPTSTPSSCSWATASSAARRRRSRASSASPSAPASPASSSGSATGMPPSTLSLLTSANEGTPVVAIESLAAERPVVATAAGGTGTVVTDGESGFLLAGRGHERARGAPRRARARPGAARPPRRNVVPPTSAPASRPSGWRTSSRPSTSGRR